MRQDRAGFLALALLVLWGCSDGGDGGGSVAAGSGASRAAASFTLASGAAAGFTRPSGLAVAKDGRTLYFTAYRAADEAPGVFALELANQSVTALHAGAPFVEPRALAASPDGAVLLVVDAAAEVAGQVGTVFRIALGSAGVPAAVLPAGLIELPSGIAIDRVGAHAYVSGLDADDRPAVLAMSLDGAAPRILCAGAPLEDPAELLVSADQQSVLVLDSSAGAGASPALFSVPVQGGTPVAAALPVPVSRVGGLASDAFGSELYVAGAAPETAFAGVLGLPFTGKPRALVSGAPHQEPSGLAQSPASQSVLYAADAATDAIVAVMR